MRLPHGFNTWTSVYLDIKRKGLLESRTVSFNNKHLLGGSAFNEILELRPSEIESKALEELTGIITQFTVKDTFMIEEAIRCSQRGVCSDQQKAIMDLRDVLFDIELAK